VVVSPAGLKFCDAFNPSPMNKMNLTRREICRGKISLRKINQPRRKDAISAKSMNNRTIRTQRLPVGAAKQTPFAHETRRALRVRGRNGQPDRHAHSGLQTRTEQRNGKPAAGGNQRGGHGYESAADGCLQSARGPTPVVVQPPVAPAGTEYVIIHGDTLAKIAKKNGVTLSALKAANPGVEPTKLKVGQKLTIPAGGTARRRMALPSRLTPAWVAKLTR